MKIANATKVGLLVIGVAVATFLVYRAVEEGSTGRDTYGVFSRFEDASGLVEKSRVTVAGIPVGYIDTIRLDRGLARVNMRIYREVPLYQDATVQKQSLSLLGQFALAIAPGTQGRPRIPDGGEVPVATVQPMMANLEVIAERVRQIADHVASALGTEEGGRQLRDTLRNLAEAMAGVNRAVQQNAEIVNRSLEHVEGITANAEPQLREILANVNDITRQIRDIVGAGRGPQDAETAGSIRDTLQQLNTASAALERTLQHTENIVGSVDRGEGTVGRLLRDERLINEVEGVVQDAGDFVGGISRLQTIVQLRADYNFVANSFKTYLELRLQPREDKYYMFQVIRDPRGLTSFRNTVTKNYGVPGAPATRTEETITTDDFRFSFEFAKRIGFATFRFGIMESTGGLGLDLHLFGDHLEVRSDLFAFSENQFPRFRAYLSYEFLEKLWVLGGIDDVFNGERTDYFLGAQLRFNDDDLKSILLFAPTGLGG